MNRQPRCYPDSTWVLFLSAAGQCSACCDNPFVRFDALIVPGALTWISVRELQASVCHLLPASSWLRVLANQCPALIFCPSCQYIIPISYTHLRAHETDSYLVCRLLLEKKKKTL